jgi:hypothetical protein
MSISSDRIDYIIRVGIHPLLKQEGFAKSSRTFRRSRTKCVQIINVQGSWFNYKDEGKFTVNLAVYFPEAAKIHGSFRITDRPLDSDCIVRQRIGHLLPVQRDYWWDLDSKSDLDKIAQKVASACMDCGLLWLNEHSTIEGAIKFSLSQKTPYWASIFSLLLGNRENAKQYLLEAIMKASQNPGLQSRLENWGRSNGLVS